MMGAVCLNNYFNNYGVAQQPTLRRLPRLLHRIVKSYGFSSACLIKMLPGFPLGVPERMCSLRTGLSPSTRGCEVRLLRSHGTPKRKIVKDNRRWELVSGEEPLRHRAKSCGYCASRNCCRIAFALIAPVPIQFPTLRNHSFQFFGGVGSIPRNSATPRGRSQNRPGEQIPSFLLLSSINRPHSAFPNPSGLVRKK
jgi:hypothetical protein